MAWVLVVDDEPIVRNILQRTLSLDGHTIQQATDAEQALHLIENNHFDVILADIHLPNASGVELLQILREKNRKAKVIIMTGDPSVDSAAESVRSGAFDYLTKPFSNDRIRSIVAAAAKMKMLEEENLRYREHLEELVRDRTTELQLANHQLQLEINERLLAEKNLQDSMVKLHQIMSGIIQAFSKTIEKRDPYTAGHQKRVSELATLIAQKMNLTQRQISAVQIAGIVHDLGKITIPAEILSKPGRITDIDFEMIKVHPRVGYEILKSIDFSLPIATIVEQHHERLNGTGYPNGLSREDILIESKILAVADVVEAIASHRPYRSALGIDLAMAEINNNVGKLYDEQAVAACNDIIENNKFSFYMVDGDTFDYQPYELL